MCLLAIVVAAHDYTRNGNIKAKLKTTEKWVTITSPDDLLKHGIDVDCKQMGCGEVLNN